MIAVELRFSCIRYERNTSRAAEFQQLKVRESF